MQEYNCAIELIPTDLILPNEECEGPRLIEVLDSIIRTGYWTMPIILERTSFAVMDGHHRLAAARQLSLVRVPCLLLDYSHVDVEARRPELLVNSEQIVARSIARLLYPPKTTRHIFLKKLPECNIKISTLKGEKRQLY